MSNYYSENAPFPAAWLGHLIEAGHIPPGVVDSRDLRWVDRIPDATQAHFFAGIGGWPYALQLAGWPEDLPVWTGSCPCQAFSIANQGARDDQGLWETWLRHIEQQRPAIIFGEQVANPLGRAWFGRARTDLENLGYSVGAADLCAACVGAPHVRGRIFFGAIRLGDTDGGLLPRHTGGCGEEEKAGGHHAVHHDANAPSPAGFWGGTEWLRCADGRDRPAKPGVFPLAYGVPDRVDRLRAYGNAIVPQVAAVFIKSFCDAAGGIDGR